MILLVAIAVGAGAALVATAAEPPPFVHNGKPFFPIGVYHCPKSVCQDADCLKEIGQAGFNCVRWAIASVTPEKLDLARANDVAVFAAAGEWMGNLEKHRADLEAKINEIKDHPALLAYETYDEPYWNFHHYGRGFSREALTAGRELVNRLDPGHPVWCNFAPYDLTVGAKPNPLTMEGYVEWTSVGNIYGMDRYPVWGNPYPGENLNLVTDNFERLKTIAGEGKTVYMVLQGVGMLEWDKEAKNKGRRPDYVETRFMGYSSIIHGARGILYWGQSYIEPDSKFWGELKRFAGELSHLHDVLCAGTTSTDFTVSEKSCEAILKVHDGVRTLIVANRTGTTKNNVSISVKNWKADVSPVLFENRNIATPGGRCTDTFQPWDVHVYQDAVGRDCDGDGHHKAKKSAN